MEQKTHQNGARAKILRALANADCGLTTADLAESAGLTAGQVRDNAGVAKKAGLLTIEQDEMTRFSTSPCEARRLERKARAGRSSSAMTTRKRSRTPAKMVKIINRIARQKTAARRNPRQLAFVRATRPTWFRGPIRQQTKALLQI